MSPAPALRLLSLGAGVQSTTVLMLAAEGRLPKLDGAIFSDTQWEPGTVYAHLDRLEREIAQPAGIPIYRVTEGSIRNDALDPAHRFASMPLFIKNQDGGDGMTRRQCSNEYKVKPIKKKTRQLLGYPHPVPVPRGVYVEQWIGISRDEIGRAKDADVLYMRNAFPLLDLTGGGGRNAGLDARRLHSVPAGQRLRVHAEECVHRVPVPRQCPVAADAGRGACRLGGRGGLRRGDPVGQRPGQRGGQAAARRGVPPPLPASARSGADRPGHGARVGVQADRHLRPDR